MIKWDADALKAALEDPRMDFIRFLVDFGSPFGHHFGSLFDILCNLECQKAGLDCRRDFYWLLNGTSADF